MGGEQYCAAVTTNVAVVGATVGSQPPTPGKEKILGTINSKKSCSLGLCCTLLERGTKLNGAALKRFYVMGRAKSSRGLVRGLAGQGLNLVCLSVDNDFDFDRR